MLLDIKELFKQFVPEITDDLDKITDVMPCIIIVLQSMTAVSDKITDVMPCIADVLPV